MRSLVLSVVLVFSASLGAAQDVLIDTKNQTITSDMTTVDLHVGGRVQSQPLPAPLPAGATSYTHQWPGVYFEANFQGDTIYLKFDDPHNEYRVFVDDLAAIPLAQPGRAEISLTGLDEGLHHIRLEKVTESAALLGTFDGFYLPAGATPLEPSTRTRQIEFIGDSDMTGYGIRSSSRECTQDQARLLSDAQAAYPALIGKGMKADYHVTAISGRGLIRNYAGGKERALGSVYRSVLPDEAQVADEQPISEDPWKPQIIFIALGENDFLTELLPDEKWATNDALVDDYLLTFKTLITDLRKNNPDAALLVLQIEALILSDDQRTRLTDGIKNAMALVQGDGTRPVNYVSLADPESESSACHYHPSVTDQQNRAKWLEDYFNTTPGLWPEN